MSSLAGGRGNRIEGTAMRGSGAAEADLGVVAPPSSSPAPAAAPSTPQQGAAASSGAPSTTRRRSASGRTSRRRRRSGRNSGSTSSLTHQGVLYKRRDVFKKRYRPRLFVLDGESGVLTYYLLNNEHEFKLGTKRAGSADGVGAEVIGESGPTTTRSRADTGSFTRTSSTSGGGGAGVGGTRARTLTDDSHGGGDAASVATGHTGAYTALADDLDATFDFDVVPRGSYYLPGCAVATDDRHSKPSEGLFAFTVTPSTEAATAAVAVEASGGQHAAVATAAAAAPGGTNGGAPIHLAAASEIDRASWVRRIAEACCKLSAHGAVARGAENAAREFREQMVARRDRAVAAAEHDDDASSISTKSSIGERDLDDDREENENKGAGDETEEAVGAAAAGLRGDGGEPAAVQEVETTGDGAIADVTPPQPAVLAASARENDHHAASLSAGEELDEGFPANLEETDAAAPIERADTSATVSVPESAPPSTAVAGSATASEAAVSAVAPRERTWSRGTAATGTTGTTFASDELLSTRTGSSVPSANGKGRGRGPSPPPESRLSAVIVYGVLLVAFVVGEMYWMRALIIRPVAIFLLLLGGPLALMGLGEDLEAFVRYRTLHKQADERKGGDEISSLPLSQSAAILTLPPLLWTCGRALAAPFTEALFVAAALYATRCLAVQSLGTPLPCVPSSPAAASGPVTCRFAIDLRGVLRYIRNRREERSELRPRAGTEDVPMADVSVTHIAVRAVALALSESQSLNCRRVHSPLFGVGGYFLNEGVAVAVATSTSSSATSAGSTSHMVTVHDVDKMSAQRIADFLRREQRGGPLEDDTAASSPEEKGLLQVAEGWLKEILALVGLRPPPSGRGECLCSVFTSPDAENHQVDVDVAPPRGSQPGITVVVGGVRGTGREGPGGAAAAGPSAASVAEAASSAVGSSQRPLLSMSVTIDCSTADVAACRKFAERVQRLMQFPELCDEVE